MAPSNNDDISISSAEDWSTVGALGPSTVDNANSVVTTSRSKGVHSESAWVKRTYCMVNEGHQHQPHVLSWSEDGEVFEIKDVNALKNDLFRKYHGETKFESFTRRLRRYGFHREKTEPLTKSTTAGRCSTVVLAFRHEHFRQNRPDLLAKLTIVSHAHEAPKASEEKLECNNTLARLEKAQEELKSTLKQFEDHRLDQKRRIDHLRQEALTKDETIRSLEFRLERLENNLLMGLGANSGLNPAPRSTWAQNQTVRARPQLAMPQAPSTFVPSQPVKGQSSNLEREISALGLIPLLEDLQEGGAALFDDEPTLPRNKKMKVFHKGSSAQDLLGLSRQTTPLFWSFPCL